MGIPFNEFRFAGLDAEETKDGFLTMRRVAHDRLIVKVSPMEIFRTRYGYGLHLNGGEVLWLKKWQVSETATRTEVLILGKYFVPKPWVGSEISFDRYTTRSNWDYWKERAENCKEAVIWVS